MFDVYTPDILRCRKSGILTGLPDAYGRGRIIGDYRRVALYGIDFLMADKFAQFASLQEDLENGVNLEATIRLREEISDQHHALAQIKEMAAKYGHDISGPATNAVEAVQWTYYGYWLQLNHKTVLPCHLAASQPSLMFTSNVTLKPVN